MKKVLSLVLSLSLVLGSFSMAFAADPITSAALTDIKGTAYEEAAGVLVDLGVATGKGEGKFDGAGDVTRAEMAAFICKSLGLKAGGTTTFKDAKGHWGEGWIALAQNMNVITGYPDGTFKPDGKVTYYEALAMITKALGYDDKSLTGTWPTKYVLKAQKLGISDNVTISGTNATRGNVAIMLFQTLDAELGATNADGEWKADSKNPTMYSILGKVAADKIITGSEDTKISLAPYVGKYVTPIENKDGDIVAIKEVKSTTLSTVTNGTTTESGMITLKDANDVAYSYAFASESTIVTGGALQIINADSTALTTLTGAAMKGVFEVKLSGKTITHVYSFTKWNQTNIFKYTVGMLDGSKLNGYQLPTKADKSIDYSKFELKGVDSLDKLAKDNVVAVFQRSGTNGEVSKIEVGTKVVEGKVTAVTSDNKKYTLDGTQYSLNTALAPATAAGNIKIGDTVKVSLDNAGKIAFSSVVEASSGNYGILLATKPAVTGFDQAQAKILNKAGDEVSLFAKDTAVSTIVSSIVTPGVIKYSVNKDGKIDTITTVALTDLNAMKVSASGSLLGGNTIDTGVVVFSYNSTDKKYSLVKLANVKKDTALTTGVALGYSNVGESKIQVMVVAKAQASNTKATYAVINDVSTRANSDNEKVQYATGFVAGKEFKGFADTATIFAGLKFQSGLLELDVDADGVITKVTTGTAIASEAAVLGSPTVEAIDGNLIQLFSDHKWYSIDAAAVVYALNEDGDEYEVKTLGSLRIGNKVNFYQVDEDSEQYDIVIVDLRP